MSDLFNVVSSWIEFHSSSESIATDGYSLLSLLDFASIPANVFASCFPRLKSLCTYKKCQQLFTKILEYNASIYAQPILERPPVNQIDTLLDEEVFVVLGGIQLEGPGYYVQSKIQYLHPVTSEWSKLTDLPEPMFGQCVTFLDNFLYVAGGSNYQTPMSSQLSQEMHRYNIQTGEWLFVAPMMEKRMGFSMTAVGNKLYVIGGLNQSCLLDSLECYDPAANTWSYVHHLEEPLFLHAAVAYQRQIVPLWRK
ncbi:kelch-like protein 14 [Saccoglossus kowalevskii]|uniref:Kelch-like protein 14-like n=1 Tax=Saccoglossus kowalevskii TaxID=10224 RepID=A0ABM0MGB9_SACKO|nr:PREDICTED: kelch-like protein 14-like [Saccoglossus kowalevskii]